LSAYRLSSAYERAPAGRRTVGLALAIGIDLLLLLVLLTLGNRIQPPAAVKPLVVLLLPAQRSAAAPAASKVPAARPQTHPKTTLAPKPPPVVPIKPPIAAPPPGLLPMSKEDLAASDLATLAKSGSGSDSDSKAVGTAPNGDILYAAEWARHPTDAELDGYLPKNAPDGFGLVACKTIPEDRVEDCTDIDETPGSHLAAAVRNAAWQFRVRPPRKNGKELVGSWVEIEIDYEHAERN
jgi:protein TonB